MVIIFHSPFFMTYSDGKLPAMRHLEGRNASVWVARTLDSIETQGREISCHPGACYISE